MAISVKTRKMLWGRAASRCAYPDCRRPLVEDETETDDPSIVGDEAHIVAREKDGPRGASTLTVAQRDSYGNLMLLCKVHHKLVDDQPGEYTVEKLQEMKATHLDWVSENLDVDVVKQRDDEVYAGYVDVWEQKAALDDWDSWSSMVMGGGQPHIPAEFVEQMYELNQYLFARIWPGRYPTLEAAMVDFSNVLNDFLSTFMKHSETRGGMIWTEKFYRIDRFDEQLYESLYKQFEYHVGLVEDLMLELTRAGNRVCDEIRKHLVHSYRLSQGALLVTSGPYEDLGFKTTRHEYRADETPYPGLRGFMELRVTRDLHFGSGVDESYFPVSFS